MKTVVLSVFLIFSCSAVSALPGNGVVTAGRSGMFITLQSALDAHAGEAGQLVLRLSDNVHTEAGVVIEGDVSIIENKCRKRGGASAIRETFC